MNFKSLFSPLLIAALSFTGALAQSGGPEVFPALEWDKRAETGQQMEPLGLDLHGDSIDPHTGALSFSLTDINLPGNSGLEVALRRKIEQGLFFSLNVDAEFGDWTYDVPRMHITLAGYENIPEWQGARCNSPTWTKEKPPGAPNSAFMFPSEYSNGLLLDVPGYGSQQVVKHPTSGVSPFPSTAKYLTGENWYLTCLSLGGGQEGFLAHAPNGDTYRFDTFVQKRAMDLGTLHDDGTNGGAGTVLPRVKAMLMASEVTDVNGNWVKYDYDTNGRLTKIHANDGREINLHYAVPGAPNVVSSATANGRTWLYNYRTVSRDDLFRTEGTTTKKELMWSKYPSGETWSYVLGVMSARPSPGANCWNGNWTGTIVHPSGVAADYQVTETRHRRGWAEWEADRKRCSGYFPNPNPITYLDWEQGAVETMSVTKKTIRGPHMPNSVWTFSYESDMVMDRATASSPAPWNQFPGHPIPDSENDPTNWTKVVEPNGSETTYYHYWTIGYQSAPGGKLDRKEVRDAPGGTLLRTETYEYQATAGYVGGSYVDNAGLSNPPFNIQILEPRSSHTATRITKTEISQDGDTFTTESSFNTDTALANYSYGHPVQTKSYSNETTSSGRPQRVFDTTYEHNSFEWVLGLPKTITQNGDLMKSFTYDTKGRVTREDRHGYLYATYTYNTDGTVSSISDAISRTTQAQNWKRGTPQTVVRPDTTYYEQNVDDNGWLMSTRDPMGRVTNFSRDLVGRLTLIDPTGNWTPTTISYSNIGSGIIQTITKGNSRTTINHDGLYRPILTKTEDLSTGWASYVNTSFFPSGKTQFTSQPSASPTHNQGASYTYDGLNRVLTETETAANATTTHSYHPSHLHIITDPEGNYKNYWSYGWGGPGNTEYRSLAKGDIYELTYQSVFVRDVWGRIEFLDRFGGPSTNGQHALRHFFWYDSRHRRCLDYEDGFSTLREFDDSGQVIATEKRAQVWGGCAALTSNAKTNYTYDQVGRLLNTDYVDPGTPDVQRTYDANGNVLTINRNGINWTYAYNTLDMLTSESLSVDGYTFPLTYGYTTDGHLATTTYPTGLLISHGPDGLGRSTQAVGGGTNYATNLSYHDDGSFAGMTHGNGRVYTRSINARQLTDRLLATNGTAVHDLNYSYDQTGRIIGITNGVLSGDDRVFSYYGSGWLKTANGPWGTGWFTYDPAGRLTHRQLGNRSISYWYNSQARVWQITDSGPMWYRLAMYDGRGNTTKLGYHDFTYDMSDQPRTISGVTMPYFSPTNGTYDYDGNFKRVKKDINGRTVYYVYSQSGQLMHVKHLNNGGQGGDFAEYIRAGGQLVGRETQYGTYYAYLDHLGSPVTTIRVLNGSETIHHEQYTPFGISLNEVWPLDDHANFTGHVRDAQTKLNYMQARFYEPVLGKFLTVDPATYLNTGDDRFFNRVAYAFNDPVNYIDPDGQSPDEHFDANSPQAMVDSFLENATIENAVSFADGVVTSLGEALESTLTGSAMVDVSVDTSGFVSDLNANASGAGKAGSAVGAVVGLAASKGRRAVNSNLQHAAKRAVERAGFKNTKEASKALKGLSKDIRKNGLPKGTMPDPGKPDRVRVPFGTGAAVYQESKSGALKLKTVLPGEN